MKIWLTVSWNVVSTLTEGSRHIPETRETKLGTGGIISPIISRCSCLINLLLNGLLRHYFICILQSEWMTEIPMLHCTVSQLLPKANACWAFSWLQGAKREIVGWICKVTVTQVTVHFQLLPQNCWTLHTLNLVRPFSTNILLWCLTHFVFFHQETVLLSHCVVLEATNWTETETEGQGHSAKSRTRLWRRTWTRAEGPERSRAEQRLPLCSSGWAPV